MAEEKTVRAAGRRVVWIEMGDVYEGMSFKAWINYPNRLQTQMEEEDADRVRDALSQVILAHNGWTDHDGTAIPQPNGSDPGFWDAISDELLAAMVILMRNEAAKYPTSLLPKQLR